MRRERGGEKDENNKKQNRQQKRQKEHPTNVMSQYKCRRGQERRSGCCEPDNINHIFLLNKKKRNINISCDTRNEQREN